MNSFSKLLINSSSNDSLMRLNNGSCIYIKTFTASNMKRAALSIEKQRNFKKLNSENVIITSAKIISTDDTNNQLSILMPYIPGISGEDYATKGSPEMKEFLQECYNTILIYELNNSSEEKVPTKVFIDKVNDIQKQLIDPQLVTLGNQISNYILSCGDEVIVPIGCCHGDLTLSNSITSIYHGMILIDFLHSYIESPLQDIAKLIQEYNFGWSFRYLPKPLYTKGMIFLNNSRPDILDLFINNHKTITKIFTLITFYRIAPYIKDTITYNWLTQAIQKSLSEV